MNRTRKRMVVLVKRMNPSVTLPRYAHPGDAGMDVCSAENYTLQPGEIHIFPTGIQAAVPSGYEFQVRPRSGLALKGITVNNAPGTIDSGYRGDIGVILIHHGTQPVPIQRGDRIAQLVLAPVVTAQLLEVDSLDDTVRGAGGFGSTGIRPKDESHAA